MTVARDGPESNYADLIPILLSAHDEAAHASAAPNWAAYNIHSVPSRAGRLLDVVCRECGAADLRGTSVLDLGCGFGTVSLFFGLDGRADHVIAVDVDLHALRFLSTAVSTAGVDNVEVVCGDMSLPPVKAEAVDVVLIVDNLHYPGLDRVRTLEAAHRLLRPGGILVVKVINGLFPPYALAASSTARAIARFLPGAGRPRKYINKRYAEAPRSTHLLRMLRDVGFERVHAVQTADSGRTRLRAWFTPHLVAVATRPRRT